MVLVSMPVSEWMWMVEHPVRIDAIAVKAAINKGCRGLMRVPKAEANRLVRMSRTSRHDIALESCSGANACLSNS